MTPRYSPNNSIAKVAFALKGFQLEDYAASAMHDSAILGHDTGGGKGLAAFVWPCLKAGFERGGNALKPLAPVLLVVPGDLHQQVMEEGRDKFRAHVTVLDSQETFLRLSRVNPQSGQRELPPGYYITSYTQLGSNGVKTFPTAEFKREDRVEFGSGIGASQWVGQRKIKCVYSPTLADLCQDTFACVAVDEGVRMKGSVRQSTIRTCERGLFLIL